MELSKANFKIMRTLRSFKYLLKAIREYELPRKDLLDYMEFYSFPETISILDNEKVCFTTFATSKVGKSHYYDIQELIKRNPEYRFIFFDDSAVSLWMEKNADPALYEIFTKIQYKASQIDVFRLCLIKFYGGIFLSLNRIIEVPFREIVKHPMKLTISFESNEFTRECPSSLIPS